MRTPIFNILSLVAPVLGGAWGFWMIRTAKGATNMGEALAPAFAFGMLLVLAAALGELAAVIALVRGERMAWLSWMGVAVNGTVLLSIYLFVTEGTR